MQGRADLQHLPRWAWCAIAAFLMLVPSSAHALVWQTRTDDAIDTLTAIAPEADVVLIFDALEEQRQSAPGLALGEMLDELNVTGPEGSFGEAWNALSERLGYSGEIAFNRFFGSRAAFVSENLTIGDAGEWAIATVVSEKLAVRLIKRLEAKGRDYLAGQPIFVIESGAYRISPVRHAGGEWGDSRLLVIAPRESTDLFRRLVAGLSEPGAWESVVGEPGRRDTRNAGVLRTNNQEVARLSTLLSADGWRTQMHLATPGLIQQTPGFSGTLLDDLGAGGWLVLCEELDASFLFRGVLGGLLPIEGDLPERLSEHATDRVVLSVRPARGGASIMVGVEMDTDESVPALVDEAMRDLAEFLTSDPSTSPGFAGFMPQAARTVRLRGAMSDEILRPMLGDRPNLAWLVKTEKDARWWVFRIGGETGHEGASLREFASALPAREEGGRLAAVGYARPAPIAGLIGSLTEGGAGAFEALNWVEMVRWSSSHHHPGKTEIRVNVMMKVDSD